MYLTEQQIPENSIVVIDHEDGKQTPYFVSKKGTGTITSATMLIGWSINNLISDPKIFTKKICTERYYIQNKEIKGHEKGVKGYRAISLEEKVPLILKLERRTELYEILQTLLKN